VFVARLKDDRIKYIVKARREKGSLTLSRNNLARREGGQIAEVQGKHGKFDMAEHRILRKFKKGLQTPSKERGERNELCYMFQMPTCRAHGKRL
jgi:hypothetical protein